MAISVPIEAMRSGEIRDPLVGLYYLPIFYLFPAELLACSEFADLPRNPHVVFDTPKWR